jgi:hypothetical protein
MLAHLVVIPKRSLEIYGLIEVISFRGRKILEDCPGYPQGLSILLVCPGMIEIEVNYKKSQPFPPQCLKDSG